MTAAREPTEDWTVHLLRRRWKPTKNRLSEADELPEIRIRIHRCCSWLQRVEDLAAAGATGSDDALVFQWIGLAAVDVPSAVEGVESDSPSPSSTTHT